MTYRFSHDAESGAMYFRLREGEIAETVQIEEPGFGAYVDVDHDGRILGIEFLSFEEFKQVVAEAGGKLDIPERLYRVSAPREVPEQNAVRVALASLEPREREILRLRFFEGLTAREAADRLGISVAAAYRLHKAALTNLRAALYGGEGPGEDSDERAIEDALSLLASA